MEKTNLKLDKNKKIIIAVAIIFIATILGTVTFNIVNSNKKGKILVSKALVEDKKYKSLKFSDIEVVQDDELNHIAINITNTSDNTFDQEYVNIIFRKKNNDIIDTIGVIIPETKGKQSSRIDMVVDKRILKSHTFTIEKTK